MNGSYLPLVHLDTFGTDVVSEELYRGAIELTFLQLQIELVISEPLEDLRNVVAKFGQVPGVDEVVVNIHYHELMEELPEHLVHETLEDGR